MATYVELISENIPGFDPTKVKMITVKGQLDESNVDEQVKSIYQILDQSPENFHLLLNFKELEYMNSKAVGYLTDWYTRITDKKGKIMIVSPKENILDILQVVGLTQLIQTYASIDEVRLLLNQDTTLVSAATATPTPAAITPQPIQIQNTVPAAVSAPIMPSPQNLNPPQQTPPQSTQLPQSGTEPITMSPKEAK